jgi:hypothetical protein
MNIGHSSHAQIEIIRSYFIPGIQELNGISSDSVSVPRGTEFRIMDAVIEYPRIEILIHGPTSAVRQRLPGVIDKSEHAHQTRTILTAESGDLRDHT